MIRNRVTSTDEATMRAIPAYVAQERAERIAADADLQSQIDSVGTAPVFSNGFAHTPAADGDTIYFPASKTDPNA